MNHRNEFRCFGKSELGQSDDYFTCDIVLESFFSGRLLKKVNFDLIFWLMVWWSHSGNFLQNIDDLSS